MTSAKIILELIDPAKVGRNVGRTNADPVEFCVMAKLVFYCGARRDEITQMRFGDAFAPDGEPRDKIQTVSKPIPLTEAMKSELIGYRQHMETKAPESVAPDEPLFPTYGYADKVNEHLKKFLGNSKFTDVHHAGIRYAYYDLGGCPEPTSETFRKNEGVKKAAVQFRLSEKQIFGILIGRIQPTGDKPIYHGVGAASEQRSAAWEDDEPDRLEMTDEEKRDLRRDLGIEGE